MKYAVAIFDTPFGKERITHPLVDNYSIDNLPDDICLTFEQFKKDLETIFVMSNGKLEREIHYKKTIVEAS